MKNYRDFENNIFQFFSSDAEAKLELMLGTMQSKGQAILNKLETVRFKKNQIF